MAKPTSTLYDCRISALRRRTKHPVRRRLLDSLAAKRKPYAHIDALLGFVGHLFAECERRRNHGALPLAYARGLYHRRTIARYLPVLLAQGDGEGGQDFYVINDTLHVPHFRYSLANMEQAEARWRRARAFAKHRKARQRERQRQVSAAHGAPNTMAQTDHLEPFCDVSRSYTLLTKSKLKDKDSAGAELCGQDALEALGDRMEAAEAAVQDVGSIRTRAKRAMTSLEVTEAALAEERAIRAADRAEAERAEEIEGCTVPTQPRESTVPDKLARWGWDASRAERHRFTERELAAAIEKVERAKRPIGNRAGAVSATILRWRSGEWRRAAA